MMITIALLFLAAPPAPADPAKSEAPKNEAPKPETAAWRLESIRKHFDGLECKELIAEADKLTSDVAQYVTLSDADHDDLLFREAYCYVAQGNDTAAEKLFAQIVHEDIDWHPSINVEDRISDRLEGARAREKKVRDDAAAVEREKLKDSVKLSVHPPLALKGGERAVFTVDAVDPKHVIKSMRLDFVKEGEREPYGIPVVQRANGTWRAEVAGQYTKSLVQTRLHYWITASDDTGTLVEIGTKNAPRTMEIAAGSDIAQDAVDRFPKPLRFAEGLGAPFVTAGFFLGGVAVFPVYWVTIAHDHTGGQFPGKLNDDVRASIGVVLLGIGPPILAIIGSYVAAALILDDPGPWIPALAVGAAGTIYALGVLTGTRSANGLTDLLVKDQNPFDIFGNPKVSDSVKVSAGVALTGVALGVLASLTTPVLVAIDNARDDHEKWEDSQAQPGEKSVR